MADWLGLTVRSYTFRAGVRTLIQVRVYDTLACPRCGDGSACGAFQDPAYLASCPLRTDA